MPFAITGAVAARSNNNDSGHLVGDCSDATGNHGLVASPLPEPVRMALLRAGLGALVAKAGVRQRVRGGAAAGLMRPRQLAFRRGQARSIAVWLRLVWSAMATAVVAAVKGVAVKAVLPSKPDKIKGDALCSSVPGVRADDLVFVGDIGIGIGITSITVTNRDHVAKSRTASGLPAGGGRGCGTPVSSTASRFVVRVAATSTVQPTFPRPLVFSAANRHTCFGLLINAFAAGVRVLLNGFSQQRLRRMNTMTVLSRLRLAGRACLLADTAVPAATWSGRLDDPATSALVGSDLSAASFGSDAEIAGNVALLMLQLVVAGPVTVRSAQFAAGRIDPYSTRFAGTGGSAHFLASSADQAFSTGGDAVSASASPAGV